MFDIFLNFLLYSFLISCVFRHVLGTLSRLSEYREKALNRRFHGMIK